MKEEKEELYEVSNDENQEKTPYEKVSEIISIIVGVFICGIFIYLLIISKDNFTRMALTPFLLCLLCNLGATISKALGKENLVNIFNKGYIVVFLLFWFGFLIFWSYNAIKDGGDISTLLFTIPFWIAGIILIYKIFIKK